MRSRRLITITGAVAALQALAGTAEADLVQNIDKAFSSNPPVGDVYFYNNPSGNTWTVNGNITLGAGTAAIDSRLFVGLNYGSAASGLLTITSTTPGSTLLLDGWHNADPILGRIGHVSAGNHTGTLNIDGGLAVTMGARKMRYDAGRNVINIVNGSLNYTNAGFGWTEGGANAFVSHVVGAAGSLIVPGVLNNAADFSAWAVTSGQGVESGDITVSAIPGFSLQFANNAAVTTITAVDVDLDDDTLPDDWELLHGFDPEDDGSINIENGRDGDPDNDGFFNDEEYAAGTDPRDRDSDDDELPDGDESNTGVWQSTTETGTDPLDNDSDDDGFHDGAETNDFTFDSYNFTTHLGDTGTDPNNPDSDGDGLLDGIEDRSGSYSSPTATGTDPNLADSDGDGMPDDYEVAHQLDPNDDGTTDPDNGPGGDPDGDGVTNLAEYDRGSNPQGTSGSFSNVNVDTSAQAVAPDDLLQTKLGTITAASDWLTNREFVSPASTAALLANGSFEDATVPTLGFPGETGDWLEFHFDTTTNTAGYDISGIDTFAKWVDYRSRQSYAIEVRPVGGDWTPLIANTHWTNGLAASAKFTRVRHRSNGAIGEPLATGVEAIRFVFSDIEPTTFAWATYREIDVFGTATAVDDARLAVVGFDGSGDFLLNATGLDPEKSYELKRSAGLTSFDSLTPPVILNGASGASQQAKDENPPAGKAFYRLEEAP